MYIWHLGTWFSAGLKSAGLTAELNGLKDLYATGIYSDWLMYCDFSKINLWFGFRLLNAMPLLVLLLILYFMSPHFLK